MACHSVTCCPSGSLKANPKALASCVLFPPRQVVSRPARSVFRHETVVRQSHPRLALPVDRRRRAPGRHRHRAAPSREATGSLPREAAGAVAGGSRSRVAVRVEAAAPTLPSRPERKGPGRYVEGGERLETAGRREPDALRASESEGRPWPCLVCAGQATVANFDQ